MDAAAVACEAVLILCILTRARLYYSPEGSGIVRVSVNVVVTNRAALYMYVGLLLYGDYVLQNHRFAPFASLPEQPPMHFSNKKD